MIMPNMDDHECVHPLGWMHVNSVGRVVCACGVVFFTVPLAIVWVYSFGVIAIGFAAC